MDSAAKHQGDIADAEQHRQMLLAQVDELSSDWRVELMLGDISEENKRNYRRGWLIKRRLKPSMFRRLLILTGLFNRRHRPFDTGAASGTTVCNSFM